MFNSYNFQKKKCLSLRLFISKHLKHKNFHKASDTLTVYLENFLMYRFYSLISAKQRNHTIEKHFVYTRSDIKKINISVIDFLLSLLSQYFLVFFFG